MNIDSLREQYMPIFDQIRKLPEFEEFVENSNIDTFNTLWSAIRKAELLIVIAILVRLRALLSLMTMM